MTPTEFRLARACVHALLLGLVGWCILGWLTLADEPSPDVVLPPGATTTDPGVAWCMDAGRTADECRGTAAMERP
jgi:hypothetical protein